MAILNRGPVLLRLQHVACRKGGRSREVAEWLLRVGQPADLRTQDKRGRTPVGMAPPAAFHPPLVRVAALECMCETPL